MDEKMTNSLVDLAALTFRFAQTDRVTFLPDGKTLESDTDHTVMLGIMACALAAALEPSLDIGKIAQFALVHDLVEAYAGDTNTFGMRDEAKWKEKEDREAAALKRIEEEFDATLPWISKTIHEYESLASPEARFIKTLDKTTPKITRLLNKGAGITDPEDFRVHCEKQLEMLRTTYGKDQQSVVLFYEILMRRTYAMLVAKKEA
jgi:putative hydrolase of HD superfamily